MIAASTSDMALKDRLYRIGIWVAVLSTLGMALTTDWRLWAVFRFAAGLSSAAGLLLGSGLILNWLLRHHHKSELGLHFSGIGLGILVSALLADLMGGHLDWQAQWWGFGLFGLIGGAGLGLVVTPGEYGLYRQRPAPREQTAVSPVSASLVGGVFLCRYRLCGQRDLYRVHRRATAWSRRLVPHFALFFALSGARSGQMLGARAQE